mmetsp:Transcript_15113/g.32075  ORF Transcript_15113/g.32075 Transcript_15113/m.32075 type:complete len:142 (+) Transcript_15113:589-1014(+)
MQGTQGINFANYNAITVDVKPRVIAQNNGKRKNNTNNNDSNTNNETPMKDKEVRSIVFSNFNKLNLPKAMKHNVELMNFTKLTSIQCYAIPLGMVGHNLMCCAQMGLGNMSSFLLPYAPPLLLPTIPIPKAADTTTATTEL